MELQKLYDIYVQHPNIVIDSRKATKGCIFFALQGATDGNQFAKKAIENGAAFAIIDNPDKSGVNTSNKVVEYTKPVDSETWAGLYFENKDLNMTLYSKVALKVRSSKGGIKMVFKLENVDNSTSYEYEGSISGNDTWEEIIFDFSAAPVADYTKVVLFFDTWEHGDDSTYYFDDVRLLN